MYYDALKTFVTVADKQNFTKAAKKLRISQPSVSLHVKNLEEEFQTALFVRNPKKLTITPTGDMLYDRAKQILAMYEQTRQDILEHHHAVKGAIQVGASFTIGEYIVPSLFMKIRENFPDLGLDLEIGNTAEIVQSVRRLNVDIGLIEGQSNDPGLLIQPFMEDELFVVAPSDHPLARKHEADITDLHHETWIAREEGSGTRKYLDHVIRSNGLQVKSMITISSNQGVKESVIHGLGLSLLSKSVVERNMKHNDLAMIPIKGHSFKRRFSYVCSPIMAKKRNVETFMEIVNEWGI
ncbi:DNA-binding transcriptional regulator, LysR family [Lentibacillus halodurans]|uniref:DNA-binding transcriptional regulator, LysR family n=1 Tax=Lentibacillus halodurans TaxID=237679 RepID=A0A1I0X054_9BACI|nr:LysR family transcriptional regulator [Lentibacillus halodurans]SFA94375.1 DNA-binding transcriptional regulator, LysR family [Lentibacillus halodurans]